MPFLYPLRLFIRFVSDVVRNVPRVGVTVMGKRNYIVSVAIFIALVGGVIAAVVLLHRHFGFLASLLPIAAFVIHWKLNMVPGKWEFWSAVGELEYTKKTQADYDRTLQKLRSAADKGYAPAQCRLGAYYLRGEGVAKNDAEGCFWLSLAARTAPKKFATYAAQTKPQLPPEQQAAIEKRLADWKPLRRR